VVADESAVTIEDLDGLVGVVNGVNVKLAKCGGIGPARGCWSGRGPGLPTFLGCMEEPRSASRPPPWCAARGLGDLDGCLLLAGDPFEGLKIGGDKRWRPADAPGLGIVRRA